MFNGVRVDTVPGQINLKPAFRGRARGLEAASMFESHLQ